MSMKKSDERFLADKTDLYKQYFAEYRKLAKRADQRLVRIEKQAAKGGKYAEMKKYAYKRAMVDIRSWSGEGAARFNTKAPEKTVSLKAKIADIKRFLEAPSSTIKPAAENYVRDSEGNIHAGGLENIYERRAATLNEKYGQYLDNPFTVGNIGDYFESALWKKLDKKFNDSGTTIKAIATIQKNKERIAQEINEHKPSHITIEGDAIIQARVDRILRYYKKDITKLF